jgi:hypothetical protein
MTKQELIKALKNYPDNAEIVVWQWTKDESKYYYTQQTLSNDPITRPERFEITRSSEIAPAPTN